VVSSRESMNWVPNLLLLASSWTGYGQGFVNLDFEDATIVPIPGYPYHADANQALPGWTAYRGSGQLTSIEYNSTPTGSTDVSILDPQCYVSSLDGVYSVYLAGGVGALATQATIKQTGTVPNSAQSIAFIAKHYGPANGVLAITLGGQSIPFAVIASGSAYNEYGGSIPTALAGQSAELVFSALRTTVAGNDWEIDNIQFSPVAIPEPSSLSVIALSAIGFWVSRKRFNHGLHWTAR